MALGETKEKGFEVFLTLVEICAAIAAIVLAALALQQAVTSDPCNMKQYNATLANETAAAAGNETQGFFDEWCFVVSETKQVCCGRDKGGVLINAGVLQLSAVVFVLLTLRLIVSGWRFFEIRRAEKLGPMAKGPINAGL